MDADGLGSILKVTHAVRSPYGYVPTEYVCAIFVACYSLSTLLHAGQSVYYRMWWLWPTAVLAGVCEIIGWGARLWSSLSPTKLTPFEIQITTTIIAPTPLVAANFVILGRIIRILGTQYSRFTPSRYTIVFCSFDLIALIIQAVGGAKAAGAVNIGKDPTPGGNIMLGGIAFQLVCITVYVAFAGEFLFRYARNRPVKYREHEATNVGSHVLDKRIKLMIWALVFNTICLFIRSVYRTVELSDGWTGRIITTQRYFNFLDGMMITLAIFTLNIAHPGYLLPKEKVEAAEVMQTSAEQDESHAIAEKTA